MKKLSLSGAIVLLSLLSVAVLVASCMNNELDMSEKELNMEVTPFQEGIVLPIGKTEQIMLKDLLKDVDQDVLVSNNGIYAVNISGSENFDDQLLSITDLIPEIEAVDLSEDMTISLGNVDVSDIRVEGQTFGFEEFISDKISAPEINIPSMAPQIPPVKAELGKYLPDRSALAFDLIPLDLSKRPLFAKMDGIPPIPDMGYDITLSGELLERFHIDDKFSGELDENIHITLPGAISKVGDVMFSDKAMIRVTLRLENSIFKSGTLRPDVFVDMSELLHLNDEDEKQDDIVHLSKSLELNEHNNYSATAEVHVVSLNLKEDDWKHLNRNARTGNLILDKNIKFSYDGRIEFENLTTTAALLNSNRSTDLVFEVEFIDMEIADIELGIEDIKMEEEKSVDLNMDFVMPEQITGVENIRFTENSGLELYLKAVNLEKVRGLEAEVDVLVELPDELKVDNARLNPSTGKNELSLKYSKEELAAGTVKNLKVNGVNLPAPELLPDGQKRIVLDEKINVKITAVAGGEKIHSADLQELADKGQDVEFNVSAKSDIEIADYEVSVSGADFDVDFAGEEIKVEVPSALAELGRVDVTLKNNPYILIDLDLPEIEGMNLTLAEDNVVISFPQMIKFKSPSLPAGCDFNAAENKIIMKSGYAIPKQLRMEIDRLVLVPEKIGEDWFVVGKVEVKGGVAIEGRLTKNVIENFASAGHKVGIVATIPELVPEVVSMDEYVSSINESIEFDVLDKLPEEITELGSIELKENTAVSLMLDASSLPSLGPAKLLLDMDVTFPSFIKICDGLGKELGNVLHISEQLKGNKITVDNLFIKSLDFSNPDDWKNGIKGSVDVNGTIKLQNAALDIDEWLNPEKPLKVGIDAGIRTLREDGSAKFIDISKVTGKVKYNISSDDMEDTEISLEEIHKLIGESGAEAVLDFNYAGLSLDVTTNLGVPVKGKVQLLPYDKDDNLMSSLVIDAPLSLNASASADEEVVTKLWLSADKDRCPDPDKYTFVNADIVGLIRALPHKLVLKFNAGTDETKDCVFEPMETYTLKVDYEFNLPLEFGEDFNVTYKYVIEDLPEVIGTVLATGCKVQLGGTITNSLPLGLDLQFNFLDSNNSPVKAAEGCGKQFINPCEGKGTPSVTKLEAMLGLDKGVDVSDIKSLELLFAVRTSTQSAGIPVSEDAFLQAELQIALPEGVTVDIKDLMDSMDNENEEDYE